MKNSMGIVMGLVALAVVLVVVGFVHFRLQPAQETLVPLDREEKISRNQESPKAVIPEPVSAEPAAAPVTPEPAPRARPPQVAVAPAPRPAQSPDEPMVSEPVARQALALVGIDPAAEAFWTQAINDPNLLPDQRRELIEDLNQDGFPDTKNLTSDDLPMIVNRLALIEEMAPNAMDDINAAAFQEAYKDLVNMYQKAGGQ